MLQSCGLSLGLGKHRDRNSSTNKEFGGASKSLDISLQSKDIYVRVIHAGGREELYENVVSVSQLMEKYPGMCVARPEVFKRPHESFLWPDENLMRGHKYYMIPTTTAKKLKRKNLGKISVKRLAGADESEPWITWDGSRDNMDESVRSAKEFFVSMERWSGYLKNRGVRAKKPFVPPLPKARICYSSGWEPSLTSVQELSP